MKVMKIVPRVPIFTKTKSSLTFVLLLCGVMNFFLIETKLNVYFFLIYFKKIYFHLNSSFRFLVVINVYCIMYTVMKKC